MPDINRSTNGGTATRAFPNPPRGPLGSGLSPARPPVEERPAAYAFDGEGRPIPCHPISRDGYDNAIRCAGWRVRWNYTAGRVERACLDDVADGQPLDWQWDRLSMARMREDIAERVVTERNGRIVPWLCPSRGREEDLLLSVAERYREAGEGSPIYEAVREYVRSLRHPARATLGELLKGADALQRHETVATTTKAAYRDAREAAEAEGGVERQVQVIGRGPYRRWCFGPQPTSAVSPDMVSRTSTIVTPADRLVQSK